MSDRVHFIGIAGIGMSAVARVMLARGLHVSGSDQADYPVMDQLRSLGADVHVGYATEHVRGAGTVVISSATKADNPELVAARDTGITVQHRSVALAGLLQGFRAVAVAGTAGKTTTTSMLVTVLQACGADPSYAMGGEPTGAASNGHVGSGDLFVVEADESDGSFTAYHPHAAIVTNVEADHLDHHGSLAAYEQVFRDFAETVSGFLVVCVDDAGAAALAADARAAGSDVRTYGTAAGADLRLLQLQTGATGSSFVAELRGELLGDVQLPVTGEHLARNAAAALLMAVELGLPAQQAISGLAAYGGVRRRMELRGTAGGVRVYDDYAHHPAKVQAQLVAARAMAGGGRLIVLFQPHLYSRTATFAKDFGAALALADHVVVMDVYAAREEPVPGVTGALVADAVTLPPGQVEFEPDRDLAAERVVGVAQPGDLVLTLGAGDVTDLGPVILDALGRR